MTLHHAIGANAQQVLSVRTLPSPPPPPCPKKTLQPQDGAGLENNKLLHRLLTN